MKKFFIFVVMAFVLGVPQHANADSVTPALRLATVDNIPPYVYVENGKLTGISIDILTELANRGGFQISFDVSPWARVLLQLENGTVDGAFSAYKTDERMNYCLYTGIIHYDELRIAVRKSGRFHFSGIDSLYGKVVGKGRKVFVSEEFDAAVMAGMIIVAETDDMKMINIKKLHEGRLDAVIGSPAAMMHYADKLGYHDIVLLPEALKEKIPAYLVLSKKSRLSDKEAWQKKLTDLLHEMYADGTVEAINKRYGVGAD